jgi:hypothetical protein
MVILAAEEEVQEAKDSDAALGAKASDAAFRC